MSTSGRSKNILRCIEYIEQIKHANTFLLTEKVDRDYSELIHHIQLSKVTARIQEHHLLFSRDV